MGLNWSGFFQHGLPNFFSAVGQEQQRNEQIRQQQALMAAVQSASQDPDMTRSKFIGSFDPEKFGQQLPQITRYAQQFPTMEDKFMNQVKLDQLEWQKQENIRKEREREEKRTRTMQRNLKTIGNDIGDKVIASIQDGAPAQGSRSEMQSYYKAAIERNLSGSLGQVNQSLSDWRYNPSEKLSKKVLDHVRSKVTNRFLGGRDAVAALAETIGNIRKQEAKERASWKLKEKQNEIEREMGQAQTNLNESMGGLAAMHEVFTPDFTGITESGKETFAVSRYDIPGAGTNPRQNKKMFLKFFESSKEAKANQKSLLTVINKRKKMNLTRKGDVLPASAVPELDSTVDVLMPYFKERAKDIPGFERAIEKMRTVYQLPRTGGIQETDSNLILRNMYDMFKRVLPFFSKNDPHLIYMMQQVARRW